VIIFSGLKDFNPDPSLEKKSPHKTLSREGSKIELQSTGFVKDEDLSHNPFPIEVLFF
jgi:hypothetical protein